MPRNLILRVPERFCLLDDKYFLDATVVIEVGDFVSAPYCGSLLAEFGATVIKIERPRIGDSARYIGPFPATNVDSEHSGLFAYLNADKHSVTLNLEELAGRDLLWRLVESADLVLENVSNCEHLAAAVDPGTLRAFNGGVISVSVTPYGHWRKFAGNRAFSVNLTAVSGFSATMGHSDRPPLDLPFYAAHVNAGINAAAATLTALVSRTLTGEGIHLDIAEADGLASLHTGVEKLAEELGSPTPRRSGNVQSSSAGFAEMNLPCADGMVHVSFVLAAQVERLRQLVGYNDSPHDDRDDSISPSFVTHVVNWLRDKPQSELLRLEVELDLGMLPVRTVDQVLTELSEGDGLRQLDFGDETAMLAPPNPISVLDPAGAQSWSRRAHVPTLGEHNHEVLGGRLGLSHAEMASLFENGVI